MNCDIDIIEAFEELFCTEAAGYIYHGGRGGGKSQQVIDYILIRGIQEPISVLVTREIGKSIKESCHKGFIEETERLGLTNYYDYTEEVIRGINGTIITFLSYKKSDQIKSFFGYDIFWAEEANKLTDNNIKEIGPTFRKTKERKFDSKKELVEYLTENLNLNIHPFNKDIDKLIVYIPAKQIYTFNPQYADDPIYKIAMNPPEGWVVKKVNYYDNPFFPATLEKQRLDCIKDYGEDSSEYKHTWLGEPLDTGSLIYPKFTDKVHILKVKENQLFEQLAEDSNCYMGIDPHSKYYPAVLWLALFKEGKTIKRVIYNEFPTVSYLGGYYSDLRHTRKLELTLKQLSQLIYSYDGTEKGLKVLARYCDPRYSAGAGSHNTMTGAIPMIELWKKPENGNLILQAPQPKTVDVQNIEINNHLDFDKDLPVNSFNEPTLYVAPWCLNTIRALKLHRLELNGKESEVYKDFSDTLTILYASINNVPYKEKYTKTVYDFI